MGVIRFAVRLLKWALGAYLVMSAAMLAWTFLWPEPDMADIKQADVIVCLGGGMAPDGTLAAPVLTRVERCVQLYEAGIAPNILFSGGTAAPDGPSAGGQMMSYAMSLGVPQDSLIVEGLSQSTLQNALFSFDLELVFGADDLVIVTEAFHLPRSWLSFHWARWQISASNGKSFQLVMSEDVRRYPLTGAVNWNILFRESLAIWFNAGRATAFSIAPDPPLDWLH
jgi:uncharacterized SAM-binding protein YcdF (DUF218 family)